jgi:hypothetical protein
LVESQLKSFTIIQIFTDGVELGLVESVDDWRVSVPSSAISGPSQSQEIFLVQERVGILHVLEVCRGCCGQLFSGIKNKCNCD